MQVVGLTGSIGMGKSAIAAMLMERGVPVFDADVEVHRLYAGEAVPLIEGAFPGTTGEGRVDRKQLAHALGQDAAKFRILENIVHPLVRKGEARFLQEAKKRAARLAVLEIPLLYETGLDAEVDAVVVVSAPPDIQRARVLARPALSEARFEALLSRQLPDAEKCRRADFVVDTGGSLADSEAQVDAMLSALRSVPAEAFARYWQHA